MDKREIIEKTKKAFQLYKENKIYQAFKEIYPVAQKIKTDKVQKLYKVLIVKAKQLLEDLYNNKEFNKLEEIEYMFFEGVKVPAIKTIFDKAKEERKKLLEELEKEELTENETEISNQQELAADSEYLGEDTHSQSGSFEFDADNFKLSSFSEDEMGEQDINALIQKGVSLYEVGDIENALIVWEKALQLQPDNEFLNEYINNAKRELGIENSDKEIQREFTEQQEENKENFSENTPPVEAEPQIEKDEPEIIFDENELSGELKRAIAIARSGDVERAKIMLNNLLQNNQIEETQYLNAMKFVSKIENEVGLSIIKNKIKNMIEDKEYDAALEYLKKNKNKLQPEEANKIEQIILQKKQEESISQSLELELEEEKPTQKINVNQIKKTEQKNNKKTTTKLTPKKKKTNLLMYFKTSFFFLLLIIILIVVIFYGFKVIQSNIQTQESTFDIQTFELQQMEQQKNNLFKKYIKEAKNYFDLGEYLFAYYTFLHAERYGKLNEQQISFLSKARRLMKQEAINKRKELKLAKRYLKKDNCEKAIPHLKNILSENPEDLQTKEKLFECYKKIAIKYALNNNVLKAKTYFNYALVLNRNDNEIPKHLKVLDRYLKGRLNQKLLTQWFYFYIKSQ